MSRSKRTKTKIRRSFGKAIRKAPNVLRPAVYSPEFCREICDLMHEGLSLTAAAGKMGFSEQHVRGWIEAHPDFKDAVERGHAGRAVKFESEFITTDNRVRADVCRFALSKVNPKDWGQHAEAEPSPTLKELEDKALAALYDRFEGSVLRPNPLAGLVDYVPKADRPYASGNPEDEASSAALSGVDEQRETTTEGKLAPKAISPDDRVGGAEERSSTPQNKSASSLTPNSGYHILEPHRFDDKSRGQTFPKWKRRPSPGAV